MSAADTLVTHAAHEVVGVSAGTAAVLELRSIRQLDAPTTAYLMVGERCGHDCAFCAQAHSSSARAHFLSRVTWPPYPLEQVLAGVSRSFALREIVRCCLQVTVSQDYLSRTLRLVEQLRLLSSISICTCIALSDLDSIRALLEAGVERVTLALDAASERVYREAKGSSWQRRLKLLCSAADVFPGRIGTHLIAGLGETEREMAVMLQEMADRRVGVGLFAFTPIPGTRWGNRPPPPLSSYRRIQVARYLLATGISGVESWRFSSAGQIVSFGLRQSELENLLADGRAFETTGCPGCNRPYYNERPGRPLYNYPRRLGVEEVETAISSLMSGLAFS